MTHGRAKRELYERGEVVQSINDLKERDYIYEEDGLVWFRSTAFGDDKDRVVIKRTESILILRLTLHTTGIR